MTSDNSKVIASAMQSKKSRSKWSTEIFIIKAKLVKMIQDSWAGIKIHVLGAGFNSRDVATWMKTGVTSMDSVSHYSDAQAKQKWVFGESSVQSSSDMFKATALFNATIAVKSALNFKVIA